MGLAGDSDKEDKRFANRKLRRNSKMALKAGKEVLPILREVSDPRGFSKDGKTFCRNDRDLRK